MSTTELVSKVRELKELKLMADELEQEITALEDAIKKQMGDQEEMVVDIFKVRWTTVKSSRFDSKSFKAKYQDLYDQFSKQTTTRRFTVA